MASDMIARGMANSAQKKADSAYDLAAGRAKSHSFKNISELITALQNANSDYAKVGDNIYVQTTNVPDFWVFNIGENKSTTIDSERKLLDTIARANEAQIGYFIISRLETKHQITYGYYHNGNFYYEVDHSNLIVPEENTIYIDLGNANKDSYIYVNNAYVEYTKNTALQNDISSLKTRASNLETRATELETRATTLEGKVSDLETDLSDEATTRQSKDTELEGEINSEKSAREEADRMLQAGINAEIADRTTAVTNEATARAEADEALMDEIAAALTAENERAIGVEETLASSLSDEADRAIAAETALNSAITAEATAREQAIADEVAERNTAIQRAIEQSGGGGSGNNRIIGEVEFEYPYQDENDSSSHSIASLDHLLPQNITGIKKIIIIPLTHSMFFPKAGLGWDGFRQAYVLTSTSHYTYAIDMLPLSSWESDKTIPAIVAIELDPLYTNDPEFICVGKGELSVPFHELMENNPHNVTKAQVGLENVDNTSDLNKPISTATQDALDAKANTSDVNDALADKANTSDVNTALNSKANTSYVNDQLATKANAATVDEIAGKIPEAASSDNQLADKAYVGTEISGAIANEASARDAAIASAVADQASATTLGTVQEKVVTLQSEVTSLGTNLSTLSGTVTTLSSTVTTLSGTVNGIDGRVSTLEGKSYVYTSAIIDNLTTDDASKVLSAKQGKELKDLINNTNFIKGKAVRDLNNIFKGGLYSFNKSGSNSSSNFPWTSNQLSGTQGYGILLSLPYDETANDNNSEYGAQICLPTGDLNDTIVSNSLYYRTSNHTDDQGHFWNPWHTVAALDLNQTFTGEISLSNKLKIAGQAYDTNYNSGLMAQNVLCASGNNTTTVSNNGNYKSEQKRLSFLCSDSDGNLFWAASHSGNWYAKATGKINLVDTVKINGVNKTISYTPNYIQKNYSKLMLSGISSFTKAYHATIIDMQEITRNYSGDYKSDGSGTVIPIQLRASSSSENARVMGYYAYDGTNPPYFYVTYIEGFEKTTQDGIRIAFLN